MDIKPLIPRPPAPQNPAGPRQTLLVHRPMIDNLACFGFASAGHTEIGRMLFGLDETLFRIPVADARKVSWYFDSEFGQMDLVMSFMDDIVDMCAKCAPERFALAKSAMFASNRDYEATKDAVTHILRFFRHPEFDIRDVHYELIIPALHIMAEYIINTTAPMDFRHMAKLFFVACMISAKTAADIPIVNKSLARFSGMHVSDLNDLELTVLFGIQFTLLTDPEECTTLFKALISKYLYRYPQATAHLISPPADDDISFQPLDIVVTD